MKKINDHIYRFGVYDSNYPDYDEDHSYLELNIKNETWENYLVDPKSKVRRTAWPDHWYVTQKNLIPEGNEFVSHAVYNTPDHFIKKEETSN